MSNEFLHFFNNRVIFYFILFLCVFFVNTVETDVFVLEGCYLLIVRLQKADSYEEF